MQALHTSFLRSIWLLLLMVATSGLVAACDQSEGTLAVRDIYAFATAPSQNNGAVFLTLENAQQRERVLMAATSVVAETVELHENIMDEENGRMQMRRVRQITVPAGQETTLAPDGLHIMLIGLNAPLAEGGSFPLTLNFANEAEQTVTVHVVQPGTGPTGN